MFEIDHLPLPGTALRTAFGCVPAGVTAVCAQDDHELLGMAVSSFVSVSLEPPLVSVCMQNTSTTWPRLRARERLSLSVLAEGQHDVGRQLSRKGVDRFAGVTWQAGPQGGVFIDGAALWLDCTLDAEVPAGDHVIALLRIHGLRVDPDVRPLVFYGSQFRMLAAG